MTVRPVVPRTEAELIAAINRPLAAPVRRRYEALVAKRAAETLTPAEYDELQSLTDQVEADHLRRGESLAQLAQLRNQSLAEVAATFDLTA